MMVWLLGCGGVVDGVPQDSDGPFFDGVPTIDSVLWECDHQSEKWSVEVETTQWSGGGYFYMARDPDGVERHTITSTEAAADGSWDRLLLSLTIEPDFRLVNPGSSTSFLCSDVPELTFLLTVSEVATGARADCRVWGADLKLYDQADGVSGCSEVLE